jgi:prevent-host-death family protein
MEIPVTEAAEQLEDLVDRALAGEDIVLTLDGGLAARLIPAAKRQDAPSDP